MKKLLISVFAVLTLLSTLMFVACGGGSDDNPAITLNKTELSMSLFGETSLEATLTDIDGAITWTNSSESVVDMQAEGNTVKLIAIGAGNATITATSGEYLAECKVKVTDSGEKILVSTDWHNDVVEMVENSELLLGTSVKYEGKAFNKTAPTYDVADKSIATVDEQGKVKGLKTGSTTITIFAEYYGYKSNVKVIDVIVKPLAAVKLSLVNLEMYVPSDKSYFTSSYPLEIFFQNGDTEITLTEGQYQLDNSQPSVAEFIDGDINALASGKTELSFSYTLDQTVYTNKVVVTVKELPVIEFRLKEKALKLHNEAGEYSYDTNAQLDYYAFVDGEKLSSNYISYEIANGQTVASVSQTGIVQAIGVGNATVRAKVDYHGIIASDECVLEVQKTVVGVRDFGAETFTEGHSDVTYLQTDMPSDTLASNNRILTYEWKQTGTTDSGIRYITVNKDAIGKDLFKVGNYLVFDAYVAECKDYTFRYRGLAVYDMEGYKVNNTDAYAHQVAQRKWFKVAVEITSELITTPKINMGDKVCSIFISDLRIYNAEAFGLAFKTTEKPLSSTGIEEYSAELFYNGHSAAAGVSYVKQDMTGADEVNARADTYAWSQPAITYRYLYINYPLAGKALVADSYLVLDIYISEAPSSVRYSGYQVFDSNNQAVDNADATSHQVKAKTWYQVAIKLTSDIISAKRFSFGDKECTLYISGARIYTPTAYTNTFLNN